MKPNLRAIISIGAAASFSLPLIWLIAASLRQPGLPPPRTIEWLPDPIVFSNYPKLFEVLPLGRYALNSLIVAAVAVPLTIVVASWAGFAMAQLADRARRRLVVISIGLLMIPLTALWLPRYVFFAQLGWINSYAALIAPALMGTNPLFVLLFYRAFRRVSGEVFESARLDGASALGVWWRVALPLAAPTIGAVGALAFLFYWGDFISPLLYLKSPNLYTLPAGLRQLQQLDRSNWPLLMAGAALVTAPAALMFLAVQRHLLGQDGPFPTE
jgi:multiple sugar transport system permease protein